MKILTLFLTVLLTFNTFAARLECTTKLTHGRTGETPKVTWCGPVNIDIDDNGVKYRRRPQNCRKFQVELFSIRPHDENGLKSNCEKIWRQSCYLIGIKDDNRREGMYGLSSHVVFDSVDAMPESFSLNASGVGHKRGLPGPGVIVRIDMSCRVRH